LAALLLTATPCRNNAFSVWGRETGPYIRSCCFSSIIRLCRLLFTQYKTTWLVTIRL